VSFIPFANVSTFDTTEIFMSLYKYQLEGIEKLFSIVTQRDERAAMLCDPPGAGKTPQAIGLLNRLRAKSALIVCPASLKENWKREVNKWSSYPLTVQVVNSLSYNLAVRIHEELCKRSYDLLVCDESHLMKSASSQTARIILVPIWGRCTYRLLMTGTPLPNGRAVEAYTSFSRCCREHFATWEAFKSRYCVEERTRWGVTYPHSKNLTELKEFSTPFMVRRSKSEVLGELPGLVRQNVYIRLPELDVFNAEEGIDVDAIVEAVENGVPLESEHITTVRRKLSMLKAPLIVEAIKDALEEVEQLVVFVHHRELYEHLMKNISDAVGINGLTHPTERQQNVDTFQDGKAKVFIASLKAANTGLTLTKAHTLFMAEYDWVPSTNEQAEGRIFRVTQNEICRVKYLVAADSLDEKVLKVVQRKQRQIEKALGET
jgi:SWI/SNF-related matrix-associated actin-dependent regulator 1 of chromatin subfamily A